MIACFDVFGTCFSLDGLAQLIDQHYGNGQAIALSWFYQTQRDFTYLSMTRRYTPIAKVFKATLPRAIMQHTSVRTFDDAKLAAICEGLKMMPPRPGLVSCVKKLRQAGFQCWAVTNGGLESTVGLFDAANPDPGWFSGDAPMKDRVVSCDEIKAAKPDPKVYAHCSDRLCHGHDTRVFIAAHSWDLGPAKDAGFTTAWVAHEEFIPLDDLWGPPDVHADDLDTLADRILAQLRERS